MYSKKLLKQITVLFSLFALTILFPACRDNLQAPDQHGKAQVSIVIADNQLRTVFPNADIAKYKLMGENNGAAESELAEFTTAETSVNIAPGNWNFTLNAYNASSVIVFQGSVQNKAISASGTNTVNFNLSPLNSGAGTVQITIQFPVSANITKITAASSIETKDFIVTTGSGEFIYTKTDVAAGDYFVSFKLYSGAVLRSVVSEMILVRGNLTSGKMIALVGTDLKSSGMPEIEGMVWIPAGTFTMGSPESEPNRDSDEGPQHSVTLSGFYMGKYEVTQEQYQTVMGSNPSSFSSSPEAGENQEKRPVERVTWYDAVEFCNKLSVKEELQSVYTLSGRTPSSGYPITSATVIADFTKNGYRLPTEAQWEYACRAGTTTAYNTGDTISDNTGWYQDNSSGKTHEVGKKPANAWGLYDMHGNVLEWCWDWFGNYSNESQTDPMGASSGPIRMARGGCWWNSAKYLRSALRNEEEPHYWAYYYGFRLVRP